MDKKEVFKDSSKKALSPVITTVLLILLAIVLAAIIMLWAFGFFGEHVMKFDPSTNEDKSIDEACSSVLLEASVSGNEVSVLNTGNVAINKIAIRKSSSDGSSSIEEKEVNLIPGQSTSVVATDLSGKIIEISPILLGKKQKSQELSEYTCEEKFLVS